MDTDKCRVRSGSDAYMHDVRIVSMRGLYEIWCSYMWLIVLQIGCGMELNMLRFARWSFEIWDATTFLNQQAETGGGNARAPMDQWTAAISTAGI